LITDIFSVDANLLFNNELLKLVVVLLVILSTDVNNVDVLIVDVIGYDRNVIALPLTVLYLYRISNPIISCSL
jgi:hypothetical protein